MTGGWTRRLLPVLQWRCTFVKNTTGMFVFPSFR